MSKSSKEVDLEKIQAFDYDNENVIAGNNLSEHEQELAFLELELERERRSKKFLLIAWVALALTTLTILTMKSTNNGIIHETYRDTDFPSGTINGHDDVLDKADDVDINDNGIKDSSNLMEEESEQLFGPSDTSYQGFVEDNETEGTSDGENVVSNEVGHQLPTIDIQDLPVTLESKFGELKEPYYPGTDLAFFWYIPKAGSTSIQEVFTQCYGLAAANNFGAYSKLGEESVRDLLFTVFKLSLILCTDRSDVNIRVYKSSRQTLVRNFSMLI
jgi:hypothetical protein